MTEVLYKLLRQQNAPEVDVEIFDGNPLNYQYFISVFKEVVETKIDDPRGRLTRLIKYTSGEARELVRNCINLPPDICYQEAIKLLQNMYGNPYKIIAAYRQEIKNWPTVKPGDAAGFRKFFNFMVRCKSVISDIHWNQLDNPEVMCTLLSKLPGYVQDRWNRKVYTLRRNFMREPSINDLIDFVNEETVLVNDALFSRGAVSQYMDKQEKRDKKPHSHIRTFATGSKGQQSKNHQNKCVICEKFHDVEECSIYLANSVEERSKLLYKMKLCYGCLKPISKDHNASKCSQRRTCKVCKERHLTTLHGLKLTKRKGDTKKGDQKKEGDDNKKEDDAQIHVNSIYSGAEVVSMCIVPVRVSHKSSNLVINTFALLDNCSQGTFVAEHILKGLKVSGKSATITVKTLNGEATDKSCSVEGLEVANVLDFGSGEERWLKLPKSYTRREIPIDSNDVLKPSQLSKWKYLEKIQGEICDVSQDMKIGLLIGANCVRALEPEVVIPSENGGPYAYRTVLGWCIVGPVSGGNCNNILCNRTAVVEADTNTVGRHHFEVTSKVKEVDVANLLKKIYENDFSEPQFVKGNIPDMEGLSIEDKKFLEFVEKNTEMIEGHYHVPLPFRNQNLMLPNNRPQAVNRLKYLERRLKRDEKFWKDYKGFIDDLISKGYAKQSTTTPKEGKCWYIPHHGVYHPNKPGKIRVVFDCSAEYQGKSINRELMSGPDLTNQIVGVLLRFREELVAFMGDVEAMFYQVKIPPEQRSYLRFLWWKGSNLEAEILDHEMSAHLQGGTSSPSCSNYAMKRTATENEVKYGPEAANTLRKNFYVDDLLKSCCNVAAAIKLIQNVIKMCADGGFNLTKFTSNSMEVLMSLPEEKRRKGVKNEDLLSGDIPEDKALGIHWNIEEDALMFKIKSVQKPGTRRGLLSILSSIYDPLGIASPFILEGRRIIQTLCGENFKWDDKIPEDIYHHWNQWLTKLEGLDQLKIDRCFKPKNFGKIVDYSLHHFSDASETGYGEASYLRLIDDTGRIHCTLLIGKARVAPLKYISIPRMELTAATLSVKVSNQIKKELAEYLPKNVKETFWTDSQVVLGYLQNDIKRFKIFVANRVQLIRDQTEVGQWNYVNTSVNPADFASRGLNVKQTEKVVRWFQGPEFLWQDEAMWPRADNTINLELDSKDPEVKNVQSKVFLVTNDNSVLSQLGKATTNWGKMKRILAQVYLFINKIKGNKDERSQLNVTRLQEAETQIIRMVQGQCFRNEVASLKSKEGKVSTTSSIFQLDPFIDEKGLLRVGGRLKRSNLQENNKHPLLLPKTHAVTDAIIHWCHEKVAHGGRGQTLNKLRSCGYWIVHGNAVCRRIIYFCVTCRKLRGKLSSQKMADLPADRVTEAPPFTYCGVDLFGPFIIKQKRSEVKRYGTLFTCLSCRAIHIEVPSTMENDSFIQCLRRFIDHRGNIRYMRSDNGSNFVGAEKELQKAFKEMNHQQIESFLRNQGADWVIWEKNPPAASHMGGVWERQIRSARAILSSLLKTHGRSLDDESLRTLMTETEAVVNSRPLTVETINDVNSPLALSPSNLLTMKSNVVMPPPGNFEKADLYSRKRWRRVQHIANEFWSRWRKEFLSSLQPRSKWNATTRNFEVGDIVLLKDDQPRNHWPMARVIETEPDKNGVVRSIKLMVSGSKSKEPLRRPISKVLLLVEGNVDN